MRLKCQGSHTVQCILSFNITLNEKHERKFNSINPLKPRCLVRQASSSYLYIQLLFTLCSHITDRMMILYSVAFRPLVVKRSITLLSNADPSLMRKVCLLKLSSCSYQIYIAVTYSNKFRSVIELLRKKKTPIPWILMH